MDNIDTIVLEKNELPHGRSNEFLLVFLLAFVGYLASLDSMLLMPLIKEVMHTFQVTPFKSTLLVSAYSLAAFLSGIFSAGIMDKFDRKKLLIFTFIGFTVGTMLCGFGKNFYFFMLKIIITEIFGCICGGDFTSIIIDVIT